MTGLLKLPSHICQWTRGDTVSVDSGAKCFTGFFNGPSFLKSWIYLILSFKWKIKGSFQHCFCLWIRPAGTTMKQSRSSSTLGSWHPSSPGPAYMHGSRARIEPKVIPLPLGKDFNAGWSRPQVSSLSTITHSMVNPDGKDVYYVCSVITGFLAAL